MTYNEGDILIPKELIIPDRTGSTNTITTMSGASLFISGAKLYFQYAADAPALISSA